MKKKSFKILLALVMIIILLTPYIQSIASNVTNFNNPILGAKGETKTIASVNFTGGEEATGFLVTGYYDEWRIL